MIAAPKNMPNLLPKVSMAGPMNGIAATPPIWVIELTMPALIPTSPTSKKSKNTLLLSKLPNMEESKPLDVEQKKPIAEQRYS